MDSEPLTSEQALALLDILSHHETYAEIKDFRAPGTLTQYGPPFRIEAGEPSTSPSLQSLLSKFVLPLPGLRDAPETFWQRDLQSIIENFEAAELSESYDKGSIGIRKTLATAISALIEYLVRGVFAGFQQPRPGDENRDYDMSASEDLSQAFRDMLHQAVYGNVIHQVFTTTAATDKLSEHKPMIQAAHEFGLVNLASFMHYTLIISPKGQYLLSLIDNANKLIPYLVIKQTLKIGNVATMINGMMRVVLAKLSLTSVTNWMGLTQNPDDGMNLLEQIISTVLNYDIRDLKSRATKIEKDSNSPSREQINALKGYLQKSREEHETMRHYSQESAQSIVSVILQQAMVPTEMNEAQLLKAQEYLSILLSVRDREQIIKVLCHSQPDYLTQAIKDVVAAYEPIIRHVHNAVDLSASLGDLEHFIRDTIKLSKISNKGSLPPGQPFQDKSYLLHHAPHLHSRNFTETDNANSSEAPTVGDFVALLQKHQHSLHRFLHQCAKNGKELTSWFYAYAITAAAQFKRHASTVEVKSLKDDGAGIDAFSRGGAGSMTPALNSLFATVPSDKRNALLAILDAHATHLAKMHAASAARLSAVLASAPTSHTSKIINTSTIGSGTSSAAGSRPGSRPPSRPPTPPPASSQLNQAPTKGGSTLASAKPTSAPKAGPGAYLARWQALLDATALTPSAAAGPVRWGAGDMVDGVNGSDKGPDTSEIVETLGAAYRVLVADMSRDW